MPKPELNSIFKLIPVLEKNTTDDFQIKRLSGFTNHNFHLKNESDDWVLRIPKEETNRYIDRHAEAYNIDIAVRAGLSPRHVWRSEAGLSLTPTVAHSRSLNASDLADESILESLLEKIRMLHNGKINFVGDVDLVALLVRYYELLSPHQQLVVNDLYRAGIEKAISLKKHDKSQVPSHNDLVLENILITDEGEIWIIDWEYSSMASPYWDLAQLCNAADLDRQQSVQMHEMYCFQSARLEQEIFFEYAAVLKILSLIWMIALSDMPASEMWGKIDTLNLNSSVES